MDPSQPVPQAGDPCAIVIFGASGDLTKRKLIPALYNLTSYGLLPRHFSIIGVGRQDWSDDAFRDQLGKDLAQLGTQPVDPKVWDYFRRQMSFCSGDFTDDSTYECLKGSLERSEKELGTAGNAIFYFSIQPDFFALVAKKLALHGLTKQE